jgi:hypothetical protein
MKIPQTVRDFREGWRELATWQKVGRTVVGAAGAATCAGGLIEVAFGGGGLAAVPTIAGAYLAYQMTSVTVREGRPAQVRVFTLDRDGPHGQ